MGLKWCHLWDFPSSSSSTWQCCLICQFSFLGKDFIGCNIKGPSHRGYMSGVFLIEGYLSHQRTISSRTISSKQLHWMQHQRISVSYVNSAYGADHAIRARKVEDYLKGKTVSSSVILEAVRLLKGSIKPSEGSTHPEYRISLAVSFLFTFLSSLANSLNESAKVNGTNEHSPEKLL